MAFMQEKRIQIYDSMGGRDNRTWTIFFNYLQDEHGDKKECPLPDADQWQLVPCTLDTPLRWNEFDCGVFVCMFCDFLAQDCPLVVRHENMTHFLHRIAVCILKNVTPNVDEPRMILDISNI